MSPFENSQVERMRDFLSLFNGKPCSPGKLAIAFDQVFDRSLVAVVPQKANPGDSKGWEDRTYNDLFHDYLKLNREGARMKIFSVQPQWEGMLEYSLLVQHNHQVFLYKFTVLTENNKIICCDRKEPITVVTSASRRGNAARQHALVRR